MRLMNIPKYKSEGASIPLNLRVISTPALDIIRKCITGRSKVQELKQRAMDDGKLQKFGIEQQKSDVVPIPPPQQKEIVPVIEYVSSEPVVPTITETIIKEEQKISDILVFSDPLPVAPKETKKQSKQNRQKKDSKTE